MWRSATPLVSVNAINIIYGTALANSQLIGSATWTVNSQSVTVPGTFTLTTVAGSVLNAGNNQIESVTFTPTDTTDYTSATTHVTVNVGQATPLPTVTPINMTYGTALSNSQLAGSATFTVNSQAINVAGSFKFTSAAGTLPSAGNNQLENVTFTPTDTTDYSAVSTLVTVNVARATPLPTVNAVNITYGTALANSQLSGSATFTVNGQSVTVAGSFSYTTAAGTVLNAGNNQVESVTFTPIDTTDYATAGTSATVNVAHATPLPTVNSINITYGTALANGQLSGAATWTVNSQSVTVPGTFTLTTVAGSVLNAGNNQIESVTFTPTDTTDYTSATTHVTVNVGQATPLPTVNPINVTYGTALANNQLGGSATFTVNGQSVNVAGSFKFTSAVGTVLHAGNNQIESVTFTPTDTNDYTTAMTQVSVNVAQATPQRAVNTVSITYGTALANSQLSGSATFPVNGQSVNVPGSFQYTTAAGTVLNAGNNQVESVTFTPIDTTDYTTAGTSATVNVAHATPLVSVNAINIIYGTALANSQLIGSATWTVNSQSVTVPGTFTLTTVAGSVLNAGNNQIESVTFTPTDTTDYTSATTHVTVNVGQATPLPTVTPINMTYGTALSNSQLAGSATFTVNSQAINVAGSFKFTSAAGTLPSAGNNQLENVTFTPTDTTDYSAVSTLVTVNVARATPLPTVNAVNITYGTALANSQLSGSATFTVNGQSVTVAGSFSYTTAAGTVLNAGNNQVESVTFTPIDTTDYATAGTSATVNVAHATPLPTVNSINITYGTALANGQLSGAATWTVNGHSDNVPGSFTDSTAVGMLLSAGNGQTKAITFTPTDTSNYKNASAAVTINVSRATPVVSVSTVNINSGTALANGQLSGTASWIVNGQTTSVAGSFTYISVAGTVLGIGNGQMENVTFAPTDNTDFNAVPTTVAVNVSGPTQSITVNPVQIFYGTALANSQLSGTAVYVVNGQSVPVAGNFAYTIDEGKVLLSGAGQVEAVTFTPTDRSHYAAAQTTVVVNVAMTQAYLIVGADASPKGRPVVDVYDPSGHFVTSFLAYDKSFHGGVRVALGDLNGDGLPEIITAPGRGMTAQIKAFDLSGHELTQYPLSGVPQ